MMRRSWSQSGLAKHCGVTSRTIRNRLEELQNADPRIERFSDPPQVYWSVPKTWVPDGLVLTQADAEDIARMVARLPKTAQRTDVLTKVLGALPNTTVLATTNPTIAPAGHAFLPVFEDAAQSSTTCRVRYESASPSPGGSRHISVHRILYGDRIRLLATCHRDERLKLFRLDAVTQAALDSGARFVGCSSAAIDDFLGSLVDGFHADGAATWCAFVVRNPDAAWVLRNLPAPMSVEHLAGGIRLSVATAAIDVLARFVVGLGSSARAETPALRRRVVALARDTLSSNTAVRKLSKRSVGPKRSTG